MAPDLLAIHYYPNVALDFTSYTGAITVAGCSSVLRDVARANVVGLTLSSCSGTPTYVTIGNATLFTTSGNYVSNETLVPVTEVFDPVITDTRCQTILGGSSVQVTFNDQRWEEGKVLSIDCTSTIEEVFYSGGGKFSFMVAESPLGAACSAVIRVNVTTVYKRVEFAVDFDGCGIEALNPTSVHVFDGQYLFLKYDTDMIDDPDVSKLVLTCTIAGVSRDLSLSPYAVTEPNGIVMILIEDPCGTGKNFTYSLSIADGFMISQSQVLLSSATNGSVTVTALSNPVVTGHTCDQNVHYFPVSSTAPWRLTQVVDNGSCVLEAGYSSQSIDVVIDEPINCTLVFEIEIISTQTRSNTTVVIDYDCPYIPPSNGFLDLPVVILVFFFMSLVLSAIIIGLELFWAASGKTPYIGRVVDSLPGYIEKKWMGVNRTSEYNRHAGRFMDT